MKIDFSTIPYNQIVWWLLVALGVALVLVIIRFFWRHLLKYLFQGCLVILAVIALLALLHYFKVF
jgi:predicted exporter